MLIQFLKAWLKWTENTVDNPVGFIKTAGLCWNLNVIWYEKYATNELNTGAIDKAGVDLRKLLKRDFRYKHSTPFNENIPYHVESELNRCHRNTARRAWVTKIITELEKEQK